MITIPVTLNAGLKTGQDGVPNVTNGDVVCFDLLVPADAKPTDRFHFTANEYPAGPIPRWAKLSTTPGDLKDAQELVSVSLFFDASQYLPGTVVHANVLSHNPAHMPPPRTFNTNMIADYRSVG